MQRCSSTAARFTMIDFLTKSIDFIFSVIQTPFVFIYVGLALLICAISIIKVIVWGKRND